MFTKSEALLSDLIWRITFYSHISFGAIALMTGSLQFFPRLRNQYLHSHKIVGKIYVVSVFLGGIAGFYIALFASIGTVAQLGFSFLAISWLYTNWQAYQSIKRKKINRHQVFMIRNYALTLAAVTLRLYLGFFTTFLAFPFEQAYPIIAWLCWIPNLIVAETIIGNAKLLPKKSLV
jgi:uncharacterized membrane protein